MANGVITGDEVLLGVVERVKETDAEFKKLLATYTSLQKAVSNTSNISGLNNVLAQSNAANAKQVTLLKQVTSLQSAKNAQTVKSATATRTNISQLKSLNSFYLQQSRLLTDLRNKYKDLEARKQLGITLTKNEQKEYAQLTAKVKSLDSALKKTDAAAGQFQRNVGNYAKGTQQLVGSLRSLAGAFGFTSGIFLFASALKDSFKRVREFDSSMQNLAGILGTTRLDIADVEKEIIKVAGASIKTSREVGELAEILATLGKRGQDLVNLIKPANDLSIALEATSADAAEFLVQTLNAFGEPTESAQDFANTITAIRTSTSLDFEKMRDSFQYITPISRILNKDLAYTGAVVGLLADNGLKAESAGRLLGTALQKLGSEGRTLDGTLEEINEAQRNGVEGYDLLALASSRFGKQAAKIGIILANNTGVVEKNAQAIRENGTALDDLVNQQLESLDAQIKILDSTWERLILTVENGNGAFARFFKSQTKGLEGMLNSLIEVEEAQSKVFELTGNDGSIEKGFLGLPKVLGNMSKDYDALIDKQLEFDRINRNISTLGVEQLKMEYETLNNVLDNSNKLSLGQREIYRAQSKVIEQAIIEKNKEKQALIEQALELGYAESNMAKYADATALSIVQLKEFIKENEGVVSSLEQINEAFDAQGFTSLDSLNKKLKELGKRRGEVDAYSQEFKDLTKEIDATQSEINKILKKGGDASKVIIDGSIESYNELIKELQKLRDETATSTEEWKKFDDQIAQVERSIRLLKEGADSLNKLDVNVQGLNTQSFTQGLNYQDPVEINKGITQQIIENKQYEVDILNAIEKGRLEEIKGRSEEEIAAIKKASDTEILVAQQKEEALSQVQGAIVDGINSVFDLRITKIDEELDANQTALNTILSSTTVSEEQKLIAEEKFAKEEARLLKEKQKREKQAFLVSQGLALAEIAITLAKTLTAINAAAAAIDIITPYSYGTAGAAYRAANIPLAIGTAAIQGGIVLSQAIPAFFKGKGLDNKYQGQATVNELPGQREVRVSKDGRVELFKSGIQKTFVKRDDIIYPSISHFQDSLEAPGVNVKNAFSKQLNANQTTIDRIIKERNVKANIDPSGIERAVERAMMKYANRPLKVVVENKGSDKYTGY